MTFCTLPWSDIYAPSAHNHSETPCCPAKEVLLGFHLSPCALAEISGRHNQYWVLGIVFRSLHLQRLQRKRSYPLGGLPRPGFTLLNSLGHILVSSLIKRGNAKICN